MLATTYSAFSFIRVGKSTIVNTIANIIITQNPCSFTESYVLIGSKSGSIATIDEFGLTSFNSGILSFNFNTLSSLTSAKLLFATGSKVSFGFANWIAIEQLSGAF